MKVDAILSLKHTQFDSKITFQRYERKQKISSFRQYLDKHSQNKGKLDENSQQCLKRRRKATHISKQSSLKTLRKQSFLYQ